MCPGDNSQLLASAVQTGFPMDSQHRNPELSAVDDKTWSQRAQARLRQIKLGKSRPEYCRYLAEVPRESRTASQPSTPDPYERISKRQFDHLLSAWRRKLHDFDEDRSLGMPSRAVVPALSLTQHLGLGTPVKRSDKERPKEEVMPLSLADHLAEHLEQESTSLWSSWPPTYLGDSFGLPTLSKRPSSERSTSASDVFSSSSSACDAASPTDISPMGNLWNWTRPVEDFQIESEGERRILSSI